jgi:TetR/AcrR family transcriptional regulator, transcriptional repressor for nem operon
MRTTHERKAETRDRILAAASRLFRSQGIDAVGVDAIMHAAGLTHGGFYSHFASKEALVAEVSATSLAHSATRWEQISEEEMPPAALARIVESYLDPAHVAAMERGCVLATLGPDVARRRDARPAITASIRRMLDVLTRCLPGRRRQRAFEVLAAMVGAVVLARLCDNPLLADEFLHAGKRIAGLR